MLGPWSIRRCTATLLVLGLAWESGAEAQSVPASGETPTLAPDDEASAQRARDLFFAGLEHARMREWAEAAASFREALALRDAPAVRYNLAAALVELSEFTEADEKLASVLADETAPAELRESARVLREQLRSRAVMLVVEVDPQLGDAVVALDDRELDAQQLGVPFPVAPGLHEATAVRSGETVASARATAAAGELVRLSLIAPAPPPPAPVVAPLSPVAPSTGPAGVSWWIWGAGAAAVLVGGVVLWVVLSGKSEDPVAGDFDPGIVRTR